MAFYIYLSSLLLEGRNTSQNLHHDPPAQATIVSTLDY